jgi:hypothetical protein
MIFVIFLAFHVEHILLETQHMYFQSLSCVLPRVIVHTSSILWMILLVVQHLAGTLYFPKLNRYTSHCYCVLPAVFHVHPLVIMCTSRHRHAYFHHQYMYFPALTVMYFPLDGFIIFLAL